METGCGGGGGGAEGKGDKGSGGGVKESRGVKERPQKAFFLL